LHDSGLKRTQRRGGDMLRAPRACVLKKARRGRMAHTQASKGIECGYAWGFCTPACERRRVRLHRMCRNSSEEFLRYVRAAVCPVCVWVWLTSVTWAHSIWLRVRGEDLAAATDMGMGETLCLTSVRRDLLSPLIDPPII
jgi:hypothetical protein